MSFFFSPKKQKQSTQKSVQGTGLAKGRVTEVEDIIQPRLFAQLLDTIFTILVSAKSRETAESTFCSKSVF